MLRFFSFIAFASVVFFGCEDGVVLQKGKGVLGFEPARINFGPVAEGQSASRQIVLTNQGTVALELNVSIRTSTTGSAEFSVSPKNFSVGPRGIFSVEITYEPIGAGEDRAEIVFVIAEPESRSESVFVTGGPIGPKLQVQPNPLSFAPISNVVETREIIISNVGLSSLTINTIGIDPTGNPGFALEPIELPFTLPSEASKNIAVSYTQSSSADEGRLVIRSDDEAQPNFAIVLLPDPAHVCSDGRDNDQDGLTDFPDDPGCDSPNDDDEYNVPECETGTSTTCGTNVGRCELGSRDCMNGLWGPCLGAINPIDETCDGVDEDCDGRIDEEMTEMCTTFGCNGVRRCIESSTVSGGEWSSCLPLQAVPESCDGQDNDCDGLIDEGIVESCMVFTCAGTRICQPEGTGTYTQCEPTNRGPETCDGQDNDCDGFIDELIPDVSCGLGACARTVVGCVNGVPQTCVPGTATAETCNNLDDDCNGSVDDLGDSTCGIGECRQTLPICLLGVPISCIPTSSTAEICNNLDDDCDGVIDDVGTSSCGVGACFRSVDQCVAGTPQACVPGTPSTELCNNIDDNCDGLIDNISTVTCGRGACIRSVPQCVAGVVQVCVPGSPSSEICNDIDDDCDGVPDNLGTISCGIGACQQTVQVCVAGVEQSCVPTSSTAEVCNNIDDDCDGVPDNLPPVVCGEGACRRSVDACVNGVEQSCIPGSPGVEICNNVDDDCNGLIDDIGVWTCGTGACERTVPQCVAGVAQSCVPGASSTEICNGVDDDCNGSVDDLPTISCGIGACERTVQQCVNGATQSCTPGTAGVETCNGIDDDCNGTVDDLGTITCGRGICERTVNYCIAGALQTCTPGNSVAETCNQLDDDCNGIADDMGTQTCGIGACQQTVTVCVAGVENSCVPTSSTAEVCNNIDDDCDGTIDNVGTSTCGVGACFRSTPSCIAGVPLSCSPGNPGNETCNNIDDDCNGVVDDLGVLTCGRGVCQNTVQECIAGVPQSCSPLPSTGNDADCDDVDDDCDGVADEHYPSNPVTCGRGVCERNGNMACNAGVETEQCTPGSPLSSDDTTCDGNDDDCDGLVDEDCVPTIDYSGLWTMSSRIDYSCADIIAGLISLVDIDFVQFNIIDTNPSISLTTPYRSGTLSQQPGGTSGTFTSSVTPQFETNVTYSASGAGCNETFRFMATFTSSTTMNGVFTAEFVDVPAGSGNCRDCVNQIIPFFASRP